MSSGFKKAVAFVFFLLAGATVGTVAARMSSNISWLSWLSWGETVGISTGSPVVLDFVVIKIAFGLTLSVNIAQILFIIIAMIIFSRISKTL